MRGGFEGTGLYISHKGQFYTVLFLAKHSETGEEFVVYIPSYIVTSGMQPTIRPRKMFDEIMKRPDGSLRPRFLRVRNDYGQEA